MQDLDFQSGIHLQGWAQKAVTCGPHVFLGAFRNPGHGAIVGEAIMVMVSGCVEGFQQ